MHSISRNRTRIIAIAAVAAVILAIGIAVALPRRPPAPMKTKVEPGQTITKDQISQNSQQTGSHASSQNPDHDGGSAQSMPTNQQFYDAIARTGRIASDTQEPTQFGIADAKQPLPGWFVVTITNSDVGRAFVIFRQTDDPNNPLTIVAGPGTSFSPEYVSLPDAVRKVLP